MKNMNSPELFSEDEYRKSYAEIKKTLLHGHSGQKGSLKAYILGGQPGAGKSRLTAQYADGSICINGDDYRPFHPHSEDIDALYGETAHEKKGTFSNRVVENLIDELSEDGHNLVIEGTLRTAEVPLETARRLKDKGYNVSLNIMICKPEVSYLSTILRYETMNKKNPKSARYIPKETHDRILKAIPDNLAAIEAKQTFDEIILWNRDYEEVYSNKKNSGTASMYFRKYMRTWNEADYNQLSRVINTISLLTGKEISDIADEYNLSDELYQTLESPDYLDIEI